VWFTLPWMRTRANPLVSSKRLVETARAKRMLWQSIYLANNAHSQKTLLKIFSERLDVELLKQAMDHFGNTVDGMPKPEYFMPCADFLDGKYDEVCGFYTRYFTFRPLDLNQAQTLRLWCKAALKCKETTEVLQYMSQWLNIFEGEPEALGLHADYLMLLLQAPDIPENCIRRQFQRVKALCFDRQLVKQFEVLVHAR
jgi:hypothetical protein